MEVTGAVVSFEGLRHGADRAAQPDRSSVTVPTPAPCKKRKERGTPCGLGRTYNDALAKGGPPAVMNKRLQ
jgi:hypothetical protein